jgi:hypothetical protein
MIAPLGFGLHFRPSDYCDPVTGIRRIEVKGRRCGQTIRLTTNEWYKAVQLGVPKKSGRAPRTRSF